MIGVVEHGKDGADVGVGGAHEVEADGAGAGHGGFVGADDAVFGGREAEGGEEAAAGVALAFDEGDLLVEVVGGLFVAGEDAVGLPLLEGLGGALEAALDGAGGEFDVGGVVGGAGEECGLGSFADDIVGRGEDVVRGDAGGVIAEASEGADIGDGGGSCGWGWLGRWGLWA